MIIENYWVVWKTEENGKIKLISKSGTNGMIPKGAYLTIEEEDTKYILRVDDSKQTEPFEPSPLIIDMNLEGIKADSECKNIISAYRIKTICSTDDDLIKYIKPLSKARKSTQQEINLAMGSDPNDTGPKVFVATVFANENKVLKDNNKNPITATIPKDFYYYQTMICGKTGSGKTVSMKYLAQNFIEEKKGAVLAINVKETDFLKMDMPTNIKNKIIEQEWAALNKAPHGIDAFTIYYPAAKKLPESYKKITAEKRGITLDVKKIEPDALIGALNGISDRAAMHLPDIFRKWRFDNNRNENMRFIDFLRYVEERTNRTFETMNEREEESTITLYPGTYQSIINCLNSSSVYFDCNNSTMLEYDDILVSEKMSVIDVANDTRFGSLVLHDILKRLVDAKDSGKSDVELLIIIDEVHQFYNNDNSKEALGYIDTICRTGRSKKIGVIFASQNPSDMPGGISSVVNTKIYFKTDTQNIKDIGTKISLDELECLEQGYAIASIFGLPQLKVLKFPLSLAGVVDDNK